jgi:hypothetical protein
MAFFLQMARKKIAEQLFIINYQYLGHIMSLSPSSKK